MAGELTYHTRLHQELTMLQLMMKVSGMTEQQLAGYYYIVRFDDDKIRLPPLPEAGKMSESDTQDIHTLIRNKWTGEAMDSEELSAMMAPLMIYDRIPIIVEMYPISEVESAAAGNSVRVDRQTFEDEVEDRKAASRIMQDLSEIADAFETVWNTIQGRRGDGRFGVKMEEEHVVQHDTVIASGGHVIHIAPSGQLRMKDGRLGQKPVDTKGKFSKTVMSTEPIRLRKDGNLWMRVKSKKGSKKPTKWIKIT